MRCSSWRFFKSSRKNWTAQLRRPSEPSFNGVGRSSSCIVSGGETSLFQHTAVFFRIRKVKMRCVREVPAFHGCPESFPDAENIEAGSPNSQTCFPCGFRMRETAFKRVPWSGIQWKAALEKTMSNLLRQGMRRASSVSVPQPRSRMDWSGFSGTQESLSLPYSTTKPCLFSYHSAFQAITFPS